LNNSLLMRRQPSNTRLKQTQTCTDKYTTRDKQSITSRTEGLVNKRIYHKHL